ncbi:hypothetical protein R1sor_010264 [Riccia sorocarpa]|uniref:Uncharacterized protein n=1 Tax=Riccia sorocarpa TaxID=122646 RepID=A0ABD3HXR7_9MARC
MKRTVQSPQLAAELFGSQIWRTLLPAALWEWKFVCKSPLCIRKRACFSFESQTLPKYGARGWMWELVINHSALLLIAKPRVEFGGVEILTRILSTLGIYDLAQAGQACKALNEASNSVLGSLTQLDLKNVGAKLDDLTFSKLSKKLGPNLKRLDVDCWHLSEDALKNLPKGIEELALCGCDLHMNEILSNVIDNTRGSLRRFAWSGFGCTPPASAFQQLLLISPKLTSFRIDSSITSVDVNLVVRTLADSCPLVNDLSAFDLTMDTLSYLRRHSIQLRKLRHKKTQRLSLGITDASLDMITGMCPCLEELSLVDKSDALPVSDQDLLTDSGVLVLATIAPTLRKLKLKLAGPEVALVCSEVAVMELASLCAKLTHVDLTNFRRLSDPPAYELIQVTSRGLKALGLCGTLEGLNLAQIGPGLWEPAISSICSGNPNLKSLVLSFARLTDKALRSISVLHQLQELALHECNRISNSGLAMIATGCPQLRFVSLSFCKEIGDAGVVALAEGCPHLLKVRFDGCRRLSNPSVRALCRSAPRLRYLSMNQCPKLSDVVFQHLLEGASLRFVELGSSKLSTEGMTAYHLKRPFVELVIDGRRFVA